MKRNTQPQPVVAWPTDEARHTVVQANQFAWQRHADAARGHRSHAERLDAEIGAKTRDLEELRREIDARVQEKRQQDHYAAQEQAAAEAFAATLAMLGEQPPPLPDRLVAGTAGMSALEAQAHTAAWNGMDPNPTGVQADPLDRFNAAHNEYAAENPGDVR